MEARSDFSCVLNEELNFIDYIDGQIEDLIRESGLSRIKIENIALQILMKIVNNEKIDGDLLKYLNYLKTMDDFELSNSCVGNLHFTIYDNYKGFYHEFMEELIEFDAEDILEVVGLKWISEENWNLKGIGYDGYKK